MVSHVVLMKPRHDLTAQERRAFAETLVAATRQIPEVKDVRVGRRLIHGAGYEQTSMDAADFVAIIDFQDLAALQAYLVHPAHAALAAAFHQSLSSAAVYDFETGGVELLESIV